MPFQLSPGVNVTEIDLTTIVPAVGTTEGAFAGPFVWGPMNSVQNIGNEVELVDIFGKPDANTFRSFFTCANFLSYARNLRVVRAASNTAAFNAVANGSLGLLIQNRNDYELNYHDLSAANTYGMFAARYPGALGNSLKVSLWASSNAVAYNTLWEYSKEFNGVPGTSAYASNVMGANDEMHIIVVDEDGKFTGVADTVLEKFPYLSKASDAKNDDGSSNYYVNVINQKSRYIYMINSALDSSGVPNTATWGLTASNTTFDQGLYVFTSSLKNGADGLPTDGDLIRGYDEFANPEAIDVSLIMTGAANTTVSKYIVDDIAESRKDCVAFVSPKMDDVVDNYGNEVTDIVATRNEYNSSSYAVMDGNWKYQFDKYNNV